jgi:hypothetical protein
LSLNLPCGWSMLLKRKNLLLMHLLNVSKCNYCCVVFTLFICSDGMSLFLEFETGFSIAENKRSCLPRIVDCSKFSQVSLLLL